MSANNNTNLVGFMTKPEIKNFDSGAKKASFAIVDNQKVKGTEVATYIPIEAWDRQAEIVEEYLLDGGLIAVQGEIKVDKYEVEGQKRSRFYVRANHIRMLGGKGKPSTDSDDSADVDAAPPAAKKPVAAGAKKASKPAADEDFSLDDDELPPF